MIKPDLEPASATQVLGVSRVYGRQFGASPTRAPHDQQVHDPQSQVLLDAILPGVRNASHAT